MSEQVAFSKFEVFYDGDCPMCLREIEMIRRMDKRRSITLTDIAAPDFDAAETGQSFEELMRAIHARFDATNEKPEQWITGVEVFREIYSRLGFATATNLSRLPVVRHMLYGGYRVFAYFRFKLAMRRMRRNACADDVCRPLKMDSIETTKHVK